MPKFIVGLILGLCLYACGADVRCEAGCEGCPIDARCSEEGKVPICSSSCERGIYTFDRAACRDGQVVSLATADGACENLRCVDTAARIESCAASSD